MNEAVAIRLADIAQVIRSKNAGPRTTTLDVVFTSESDFTRVRESRALTAEKIAKLYGVVAQDVRVIEVSACRAIKITFPRQVTAGDPGDRDVYGAQQHARLFEVRV